MKAEKRLFIAIGAVVLIAGAFWILLLSPKREEAAKLGKQVEQLQSSLAQHESEVASALASKKEFPENYGQLVVLGKAVPADSETPSLLVQLQHISDRSKVRFEGIALDSEGGEAASPVVPESEATGANAEALVSPTEVAASISPLGASVGPAGLSAMPYTLTFTGDFFHVANFIRGLDDLVRTTNSKVSVTGRLITVNAFSLSPSAEEHSSKLQASFSVTTYLTPPEQGLTAGATAEGPAEGGLATATQTAETIGGTP